MGSARRPQPKRLASKLLQIRKLLDLTQEQMAELFSGVKSPPKPAHISRFEQGGREPSLLLLLAYARLINVSIDILVDDSLDLPEKPPIPKKHEAVRRSRVSKKQK